MLKLKNKIFQQKISSNERSSKVKINITFMVLTKGVTVLISLLYVPLLIKALNTFNYGIWLTLTSISAWFYLIDAGLGNGLRNKLAISLAEKNILKAKKYISTAYASIAVLCMFMIIVFALLSSFVNWCTVLNAPDYMRNELTILVNTVFLLFFIQFFFSIINSVLLAFQWPAYSSLVTLIGQFLSFASISIIVYNIPSPSLILLGAVMSISPVLVLIIFSIIIFSKKLKAYKPSIKYVERKYLNDILGLGVKFFLLQIITIVFYQTANILIAHNVGPNAVTEFNVAYKYLGIISMLFTIVITPFWSAATEAYTKGDLKWIKDMNKNLLIVCGLFSIIGIFLLIFSGVFYHLWIGNSVTPNYFLLALVLIYFIFNMLYGSFGYILNGIGKIKLQLYITAILALAYLPGAYILSKKFGLTGIIISMILVSLINSLWAFIQFKKIINQTAKGIWNK